MAWTLAWECCSRGGSVAALGDDDMLLAEEHIADGRTGADLVPLLQRQLEFHGRPSALAVAVGPGSFTGLRVAVIAARTLAWIEDLPVHGVCAMQALAVAAGPGDWWVAMPLKKDTSFHVLVTVHDDGRAETIESIRPILDREPVAWADDDTWRPIGPAWQTKAEVFTVTYPHRNAHLTQGVQAAAVARSARHVAPSSWRDILPAYHQASAPELQRQAQQAQQ